jgi:integrase
MDEVMELPPGTNYYRGGLVLKISEPNDGWSTRRWMFRYRSLVTGRRTETALGSAYIFDPTEARQRLGVKLRALYEGTDPVHGNRKREKAFRTFGEVAAAFIAAKAPGWSTGQKRNAELLLLKHGSALLKAQMNAIDPDKIEAALKPLWTGYPAQAERTRTLWYRLFEYAANKEWFSGRNPCQWKDLLEDRFPDRLVTEDTHHPAMPWTEVPEFMKRLRSMDDERAVALELVILTWTRTNEVLGAQLSEVDFHKAVWTIPTARTKLRRDKKRRFVRIPLSTRALELFERQAAKVKSATCGAFDLFALHPKALIYFLRGDMNIPVDTVAGFRSSAREWGDEQGYREDYLEKCLSHKFGNPTRGAYQRDDSVEGRREIVQAWSDFCDGRNAVIVHIPRTQARS